MYFPLLFCAQALIIFSCARFGGWAFRRLGQPAVMGEIASGIALGPSLLGILLPRVEEFFFFPESLIPLRAAGQGGIILFLFSAGLHLNLAAVRPRIRAAALISFTSIAFPMLLGSSLACVLYRDYAAPGAPFSAFVLFMAVAMSVTAFPVLVRILEERGLMETPLGAIALSCAVVDDISAWCLLAVLTGMAHSHSLTGFFSVGAFMAGAAASRLSVRKTWSKSLEKTTALLVPLFFAFSGMRTRLDLLNGADSLTVFLLVLGAAILGKFGGSFAAARFCGMNKHDAFAIGALMNTRGLMELIVLNAGYDLGIISSGLFTLMVLMALVTTLMTGPALSLNSRWRVHA